MALKILFVCVHNSARSQMAEAYVNLYGKGRAVAESAGLEPGTLNPVVVAAMKEDGIDISGNTTHGVQQYLDEGRVYDYVITVCDETAAERCPVFPGGGRKLHWPFPDPSALTGEFEDKLYQTRLIRGDIKKSVADFLHSLNII